MTNIVNGYWADHPTVQIDLDNQAVTVAYSGNIVATLSTVFGGNGKTYIQTFTNNGTKITGWSKWVTT